MPRPFASARALIAAASRRLFGPSLAVALTATAAHADLPKSDEEVTLYPTVGWLDPESGRWVVPIHGCIYEPERDSFKRRALLALLARRLHLTGEENDLFRRRAAAFLVDHESGKRLEVAAAESATVCEPSGANGQFRGRVELAPAPTPPTADASVVLRVATRPGDDREFSTRVQLLSPRGISVVCDIDDTVKVTDVTDTRAMLRNTFLREFQPVAGMPALVSALAAGGASVHYVSASPWQLLEPLREMFGAAGLPAGSMHLKSFRWKDQTLWDLLASPESFKPPILRELLERFPQRRFILIGDTSERDPEIYGAIAREHPGRVAAILIRVTSPEQWTEQRQREAFDGIDSATVMFNDPANVHAPSVLERASPDSPTRCDGPPGAAATARPPAKP